VERISRLASNASLSLSLSLCLSLVSVLLQILNYFIDVGLGSKLPKLALRYDG
jgi:hypothetical protein